MAWKDCRSRGFLRRVVGEALALPAIPAVTDGLEDVAAFHLAAVDVQSDGALGVRGVVDGVVFVRGDEATGRADGSAHAFFLLEAEFILAALLDRLVLHDANAAFAYRFHAPHARVIMNLGSLTGSPGHDNHRIAIALALVEQAACVVAFDRPANAFRQNQLIVSDQLAEVLLDAVDELMRVATAHGRINRFDQSFRTLEILQLHVFTRRFFR